ncbi:MAG: hypothetical protein ACLPWF_09370 [Bryobacteraceae bacterium]|jgi:hypothetical protein
MQPLERKFVDEPDREPEPERVHPRHTWIHKLGVFLFIIVCFEVGAFLTVFPWTPQWDNNSMANLLPGLHDLWASSYFRGALSGLGLLNIYISLGEVSRLRRPRADRLRVSTL